jgi:hypothetical protein
VLQPLPSGQLERSGCGLGCVGGAHSSPRLVLGFDG